MIIAVDCDDVLADSMEVFINYYNKNYGTSLTKDHFFSSMWWDIIREDKDVVINRYLEFIENKCFDEIKPVPGAVEAIKKIKKKHELIVVTGRPNSLLKKTKKWVNDYFPNFFNEIHCTNLHFANGNGLTKGDICKNNKVDLLIDDYIEFGQECVNNNIEVFLMNQPWNKQAKLLSGITRVMSWQDVMRRIS